MSIFTIEIYPSDRQTHPSDGVHFILDTAEMRLPFHNFLNIPFLGLTTFFFLFKTPFLQIVLWQKLVVVH